MLRERYKYAAILGYDKVSKKEREKERENRSVPFDGRSALLESTWLIPFSQSNVARLRPMVLSIVADTKSAPSPFETKSRMRHSTSWMPFFYSSYHFDLIVFFEFWLPSLSLSPSRTKCERTSCHLIWRAWKFNNKKKKRIERFSVLFHIESSCREHRLFDQQQQQQLLH